MSLSTKIYSYFFVISLLVLGSALEYTHQKTTDILAKSTLTIFNSELAEK
ncbi:hypothetical protein [uncultured Shewanella sp.]|nr:hypothetical protein [uncultured Shewanella sp.]